LLAASSSSALLLPIALLAASSPPAARSMTPGDASLYYDDYAPTYDDLDGGRVASSLGIDDARKSLLGDVDVVRGRVLEVGAGTGLNLGSYRGLLTSSGRDGGGVGGGGIESLTLVDVSGGMLDEARARWEGMRSVSVSSRDNVAPVVVEFVRADATSELLSLFGEGVFDVAVDTFGLCVMGDDGARRCLRELTGVVKKGGEREREKDMRRDEIWQGGERKFS
jgi:ubiquinone/menaquinone biosynthesis C-methylase UbiE